mgnify:CR=1 FL=1
MEINSQEINIDDLYSQKYMHKEVKKGIFLSFEHRMPVHYGDNAKKFLKEVLLTEFKMENPSINQPGFIFRLYAFVKDEAFRSEREYRLGFCFVDEMDNSEVNKENAKRSPYSSLWQDQYNNTYTKTLEQIKQYNQTLEERIQALEAKLQQNNQLCK